jgi:hypothetical protein
MQNKKHMKLLENHQFEPQAKSLRRQISSSGLLAQAFKIAIPVRAPWLPGMHLPERRNFNWRNNILWKRKKSQRSLTNAT